jgi:prepilin-type N-terminal cleavage/methylation domain-containing protein
MTPYSVKRRAACGDEGFTLIELMVALLVLMVVSGAVLRGVMDMSTLHNTIMNRTDMHAGVRNATQLLSQEVGQAGRVSLPAAVTLTLPTLAGATAATVSSATDMFVGEQLLIDAGDKSETVTITAIAANVLTTTAMEFAHDAAVPISVTGGFAAGVVPSTAANGSTATKLKIFGDIDGNGRMVYVEYWCDLATGRLYRNSVPFTAAVKPAYTTDMVLIDNILANPGGTPCFTYQTQSAGGVTYVTDVAITLTVRTQNRDVNTNDFQTETKALLNVSPRNVFNVWQMAGLGFASRVQPTPASVTALLP